MSGGLGILSFLRRGAGRAFSLDEIAAARGLRRTVAHGHLERLAAAGLVVKGRRPGARGRPANTYRYVRSGDGVLAGALIDALASSPAGPHDAWRAGRRAGQAFADLDALGGPYVVEEGGAIHALSCMFGESCEIAPQIVCGLHAGLIEGSMEAAGRSVELSPEGPDGSGGCRFRRVN